MHGSKTINDYVRIAAENQLQFISSVVPDSVRDTALWRCLLTGQVLGRNYRSIRDKGYGSSGAKFYYETREQFIASGARYGVEFVEDRNVFLPETTKHPAIWRTAAGTEVVISYNNISYAGRLLEYQKALLGLESTYVAHGRNAYTADDVYEEAEKKRTKVLFIPSNDTLDSMSDHIILECLVTGMIFSCTFYVLREKAIPSPGLRQYDQTYSIYQALALTKNIQWLPDSIPFKPQSDRHPTAWSIGRGAKIHIASFKQMFGSRGDNIIAQMRNQSLQGV
jgi:hypothetical protein